MFEAFHSKNNQDHSQGIEVTLEAAIVSQTIGLSSLWSRSCVLQGTLLFKAGVSLSNELCCFILDECFRKETR